MAVTTGSITVGQTFGGGASITPVPFAAGTNDPGHVRGTMEFSATQPVRMAATGGPTPAAASLTQPYSGYTTITMTEFPSTPVFWFITDTGSATITWTLGQP